MRLSRLIPTLAAALAMPAALAAQVVRGTLVDPRGAPVERVLVVLVDSAGAQFGGAVTDSVGAFSIVARAPGRYALRAERIGYETVLSPRFTLADGETREQRLVAAGRPVMLDALTVTPQARRCAVRPGAGIATATLWEEARKALNATSFGRHQLLRYDIVRWVRDTDLRDTVVLRDVRAPASDLHELPFVSIPPAELARRGYVRTVAGDTLVYFAPDADVLLSDEFLDGHCFHVAERGADSSLVGLAFEPAGRARRVTDVRGVLWLERGTARLRRLEYAYANGPSATHLAGVGGTVEFAPLPSGPWIVRRWGIRMAAPRPPLASGVRRTGQALSTLADVVALRENGGEVTAVAAPDAQPVVLAPESAPAFVEGVAWDSTRHLPLRGVPVRLSGTDAEATTDSAGRSRIEAPAPGRYTLEVADSTLGPLLAAVPRPRVALAPGRTAHADVAVPPTSVVAEAICPRGTLASNQGVIFGRATTIPPETNVVAQWMWLGVENGHLTAGGSAVHTEPGDDGWFVLCGVREQGTVSLSLRTGSRMIGVVEVTVDGILRRDLDGAELAASAPPSPVRP
jgi:hypothetical protein